MQVYSANLRGGILAVLCCMAASITVGCDDGRPARVPVSGRVLVDGRPLHIGNVKFIPDGARPSSGTLDATGRFTLTCYDGNDGAVPGMHRIQISGSEITNGSKVVWHAPIKYANPNTSGMTFEVTGPTDSLVIELTSNGGSAKIHTEAVTN